MSGTTIVRDTRGYYCSQCRQRFSITTNNIGEIKCQSCQRVSSKFSSSPSPSPSLSAHSSPRLSPNSGPNASPGSGRVLCIDQCKNKFFPHLHRNSRSNPEITGSKLSSSTLNTNPSALSSSSSSHRSGQPRKRALLIGVTYKQWKYRLKGTVNDVKRIRNMLIDQFAFQKENILVLTEEEIDKELSPTKKNIQSSLKWLVENCRDGDSLVFYFSGHGLRQPDFDKDERDGFDETICPVDFLEEGMILDNDINSVIVQPLPKGVTLHAIVDACHSGTILDLVHVYDKVKRKWMDNSPPNGSWKHTNGGLAISISACEDDQMAADTTAFNGKEMNGALTYILVEIVKKHPGPTYGDLIDMIHETIDKVNNSGCGLSKVVRTMFNSKLLQKPLLSASEEFDVYKKHFIL
ncbi:hypothetical protein JCGZ_24905 [Jatropha curcas]|uniref:Peptidase C14 caspase domain-containing protein n=1 Tax=Jatropha curcas TaxID=180498 RepID=A0A067KXH3_JATCU|nr:metacaspase-1 [Jatropha curcas]KDP40906.1 hypothetical protein JCGZ_24905 [Jatropha curcas]